MVVPGVWYHLHMVVDPREIRSFHLTWSEEGRAVVNGRLRPKLAACSPPSPRQCIMNAISAPEARQGTLTGKGGPSP